MTAPLPSIAALRARLVHATRGHPKPRCTCDGCDTIRVLDAVTPLLQEHQNCCDGAIDCDPGMEPTERVGWEIDRATLDALLAGEGGAT